MASFLKVISDEMKQRELATIQGMRKTFVYGSIIPSQRTAQPLATMTFAGDVIWPFYTETGTKFKLVPANIRPSIAARN